MTSQASLPAVLFLCTGNSCRSQMAEGFARRLLAGRAVVHSAGVEPHGLNPRAVAVMAEAGFPIDDQRSKHVTEFTGSAIDLLVTVCGHADEACPALPNPATGRPPRRVHRGFDDPPKLAASARTEAEALSHYRRVRDEIHAYVERDLPRDLGL